MQNTREHSADLIAEICLEVEGVGRTKGYALSEYLDSDWATFLNADIDKISGCRKANGKSVFTPKQIEELVFIKEDYLDLEDIRTAWIYQIGKNFLISQMETLRSTSLDNLDINPFLMKVLNLKKPEEILEFNLYQAVTRSIVTSWGIAVESLLFRCGADKFVVGSTDTRAGGRPDLEKNVNGKKSYIQVKSGPNTMNVQMVNSLNDVIEDYKRRDPDAAFFLGMTYGTKDRISAQIRGYLSNFEESVLVGRGLWDFISEERDFHRQLFEVLDQSSRKITLKTFSEHLKDQLVILVTEWELKFGDKTVDQVYENYL